MIVEHDLADTLRIAADLLCFTQQARQRLDAVLEYWHTLDMDSVLVELNEIQKRLHAIYFLQTR